jgi:hypothetical protein
MPWMERDRMLLRKEFVLLAVQRLDSIASLRK